MPSILALFLYLFFNHLSFADVHRVDLSGLILKSKLIGEAIDSGLRQADPGDVVQVDVSSCQLGDEGFREIVDKLILILDRPFHLVARMNQLSPEGVHYLFQRIVDSNQTAVVNVDLCWNNLSPDALGYKQLEKALQKLVMHPSCPSLRLDCCGVGPSFCRALAKGLMERKMEPVQYLSLSGNAAIGDGGTAALAAALKMNGAALNKLDLSACCVGDVGVEALAVAIENERPNKVGLSVLDLSCNQITEDGATLLGRALFERGNIECLDLSNNKICDRGAIALAKAVGRSCLRSVFVCSCHIHAEGASEFGKAMAFLSEHGHSDKDVLIDLSGNPLGVLRGQKKDGGKYSASRLKSKASATAASYMNQGLSFLKKGLKDVGVASMLGPDTVESDDEEEEKNHGFGELTTDDMDPSRVRCGAKALANAFIEHSKRGSSCRIYLKLRHCFLDHSAADALAAMLVHARDETNFYLTLDVSLNPVLEESMVAALHGDEKYEVRLREMAERYVEAVDSLRKAQERAEDAVAAVQKRVLLEEEAFESDNGWEVPVGLERSERDSDADYEDEETSYS